MGKMKIKVHEATAPYKDEVDKERDDLIAQGKKDMQSFSPKTVKIGRQTWMQENLAIDDGGDGIGYNSDIDEYYYTWEAAKRIADGISGWHLPSVDEWNVACNACGVDGIESVGWNIKAAVLYDKLRVLPAGYNSFRDVDSGTYFWTSTGKGRYAHFRFFDINDVMSQNTSYKGYGYSVRLVKDS